MQVDMHCHLLPRADHGSSSLTDSITMVRKAEAVGIDTILATPHFYMQRHDVESFLARREMAYNELIGALDGSAPNIIKAAEVTLQIGLCEMENLDALCIDGTKYLLLEMPQGRWTDWVYDAVYQIQARRGLTPIIAHIDRYDESSLDKLLDMNVITQMNALPLSTFWGRARVRKYISRVHVLGSDAHMDNNGNVPEYAQFERATRFLGSRAKAMNENAKIILGI